MKTPVGTPIRALITGASGFVGSHVTLKFLQEGWEVHVIIRPNSSLKLLDDVIPQLHIHYYDGTFASISAIVNQVLPHVTVHLASFASIQYQPHQVDLMVKSNVVFGTQLAEALAASPYPLLVNTSSFSQHADQHDYNPNSLYAGTKQAYEDILKYFTEANRLQIITLTLFDNYGPRDPRSKIINLLYDSYLHNKPLNMSPGEQYLDLVYIEDVADAYVSGVKRLLSGHSSSTNEKFVVSSGTLIQLKYLVVEFEEVIGTKLQIHWGAIDYRPREIFVPWRNGLPLPDWTPKISLHEGLRLFIAQMEREGSQ